MSGQISESVASRHQNFVLTTGRTRLVRTANQVVQVGEHQRQGIRAIHALEIAAKFPQQGFVENHIEHFGGEPGKG